jgi:hypothetical protein
MKKNHLWSADSYYIKCLIVVTKNLKHWDNPIKKFKRITTFKKLKYEFTLQMEETPSQGN